jgi:hypothetical protein
MQRGNGVNASHVTAHAGEHLGLEIQAATLLPDRPMGRRRLHVWSLMTGLGNFWLVEEAGVVELFRADRHGCRSGPAAARGFVQLHPDGPPAVAEPPVSGRPSQAVIVFSCRVCGACVTRRRRPRPDDSGLCPRCAHAERERRRYQTDARYRARCLAASAERYRRRREGVGL